MMGLIWAHPARLPVPEAAPNVAPHGRRQGEKRKLTTVAGIDPDDDGGAAERGGPSYSYKPSLLGAPSEYRLKPEGLAWSAGRYSGTVRYDRITHIGLSFRPVTMQTQRYIAEIWSTDNPKLRIASTTCRSLMEQARQDAEYTAFITELHRRIGHAGSSAQFIAGTPGIRFWLGVVVFVAAALGLGTLMVRALLLGEMAGAALVGGFFLLFVWQVGWILLRNQPGTYRPDALPAKVLPPQKGANWFSEKIMRK